MNKVIYEYEVNIYVEHRDVLVVRSDVCSAYLVEQIKRLKAKYESDNDISRLNEKKLLSIEEAARLYSIGRSKLYELTNSDMCTFVLWVGSHRLIKREPFEKYIEGQFSI